MQTVTDTKSPIVCFILGTPGAGKGTLCARLAAEFDVHHLSVGDFLRTLSDNVTRFSEQLGSIDLNSYLSQRRLLPADVMTKLLACEMAAVQQRKGSNVVLIDGFPRTVESAVSFEQQIAKPSCVILLDCPQEIAKKRFLNRARGDDDAAIFDRRYAEFEENNRHIMERYRDMIQTIQTDVSVEIAYGKLRDALSSCCDLTQRLKGS